MMIETTWLTIDLHALRHNVQQVRVKAPHAKVLAMAKANAYGHGLLDCAQVFQEEADAIGVARLEEALALRTANIRCPILLLGTHLSLESIELCAEKSIWITVHSAQCLESLATYEAKRKTKPNQKQLVIWLKLNSGMNRLGLREDEFAQAHQRLLRFDCVAKIQHMTHFASADTDLSSAEQQKTRLLNCSKSLGIFETSCANSAGILRGLGQGSDWVRPGIMLYGADPLFSDIARPEHTTANLKPVAHLFSRVLSVYEVNKGETVGYSGLWQADKNSKIATLGIGYGDGYPRHAKSGCPVYINNTRCQLIGRVSMDLIAVNVSECAGVKAGDTAELWGEHIDANEVATYADTISYTLFTGVTTRVTRI